MHILNRITSNVFRNYVSNKFKVNGNGKVDVNGKDPPGMTDFIKSKIEWRGSIYKTFQDRSKIPAEYNTFATNNLLLQKYLT